MPDPTHRPAARPLPDHLDRLTVQEFSRLFAVLRRVRVAGGVLTMLVVVLLVVLGSALWEIALASTAGALLLAFGIRDLRRPRGRPMPPEEVARLFGPVLFAHATVVTLSGGIHSPFVIVFPPVIFLVALGTGHVRHAATTTALVLVFVWVVAFADLEATVFAVGSRLPPLGGATFAIVMATVLTLMLAMTTAFGLLARGAIERAVAGAHEARAETLATMQDRNRELWSMSGAVAHELKNPLASVRGLGSLLARKVEPGTKQAERMGVMLEEVERMGSIIDEFLNFSRPVTAMTRRPTDPSTLIEKVDALHRPLLADAGVELRIVAEATNPLSCDPRKITQVLVNLLHNAIDASPEGGVIELALREDGERVVFEVVDQGPGIDPAVRERLFRPGATTKPQGSGIGLTVARAIAEQHGGELTLEQRPEGGCRATLTLPREPAAPPPSEDDA